MFLWGVDIGEAKLDLAVEPLGGGAPVFGHLPPEGKRSPARFAELHDRVVEFGAEWAGRYPPSLIVVERPVGRFPNPWLTGAWAVILGAFTRLDVPVWTIDSREWKKLVGLKGNAVKATVIAWAESTGVAVQNEHQADAVGVLRGTRIKMAADVAWQERANPTPAPARFSPMVL